MTAIAGTRDDRRASPLGVGVVVWLSSELMFFAGLFAAYFTVSVIAVGLVLTLGLAGVGAQRHGVLLSLFGNSLPHLGSNATGTASLMP